MDKQYKNLMDKQNISTEVTAEFYEKLEAPKTKHKTVRWKVALAAACIALLIPVTVLAVENIFSTPKVKIGELTWTDNPNGFSVRFENLDNFPLDALPKDMRNIDEIKRIPYESWEAAEDALGIDLLNNTFLAKANKIKMRYDDIGNVHCKIVYNPFEGQLFYVSPMATYKYNNVQVDVKAKLTVEHPELDEETKQVLHGIEGAITKPENVETTYEEYTTKEGIPVVILRWELGYSVQRTAVFSVNNISYEVTTHSELQRDDANKQVLIDTLDGFKLK